VHGKATLSTGRQARRQPHALWQGRLDARRACHAPQCTSARSSRPAEPANTKAGGPQHRCACQQLPADHSSPAHRPAVPAHKNPQQRQGRHQPRAQGTRGGPFWPGVCADAATPSPCKHPPHSAPRPKASSGPPRQGATRLCQQPLSKPRTFVRASRARGCGGNARHRRASQQPGRRNRTTGSVRWERDLRLVVGSGRCRTARPAQGLPSMRTGAPQARLEDGLGARRGLLAGADLGLPVLQQSCSSPAAVLARRRRAARSRRARGTTRPQASLAPRARWTSTFSRRGASMSSWAVSSLRGRRWPRLSGLVGTTGRSTRRSCTGTPRTARAAPYGGSGTFNQVASVCRACCGRCASGWALCSPRRRPEAGASPGVRVHVNGRWTSPQACGAHMCRRHGVPEGTVWCASHPCAAKNSHPIGTEQHLGAVSWGASCASCELKPSRSCWCNPGALSDPVLVLGGVVLTCRRCAWGRAPQPPTVELDAAALVCIGEEALSRAARPRGIRAGAEVKATGLGRATRRAQPDPGMGAAQQVGAHRIEVTVAGARGWRRQRGSIQAVSVPWWCCRCRCRW
jgi:hypothetical protein